MAVGGEVKNALIAMVLHHCDDPAGLLTNVARLLGRGRRLVVAEFAADGPCEQGPPRAERLAPASVHTWCESAGLRVLREERQSPEHYMLLAVAPGG